MKNDLTYSKFNKKCKVNEVTSHAEQGRMVFEACSSSLAQFYLSATNYRQEIKVMSLQHTIPLPVLAT